MRSLNAFPHEARAREIVLLAIVVVMIWLGGISALGAWLGVPAWALVSYALWILFNTMQMAFQTFGAMAEGPWGALRPAKVASRERRP